MKCTIIVADEGAITAFLGTNPKILSKHVIPATNNGGDPCVLFFYDTPEDDQLARDRAIIEQDAQMGRLIDIAREVSQDKNYTVFKNNTQKEIYLLTRHNLPKSDAAAVIELLKPEMASVLGA